MLALQVVGYKKAWIVGEDGFAVEVVGYPIYRVEVPSVLFSPLFLDLAHIVVSGEDGKCFPVRFGKTVTGTT